MRINTTLLLQNLLVQKNAGICYSVGKDYLLKITKY